MPQTNSARVGMRLRSYHHAEVADLLGSADAERHYKLHDVGLACSMVHSVLRLRRLYGYEIIVTQDGCDVWICKPGSPRTMAPDGYISTHDAAKYAGVRYMTYLARMRALGIKSLRVGQSAYITHAEAARAGAYGRGAAR